MDPSKAKAIHTCIENFDFQKMHTMMMAVDWEWWSTDFKVPTVQELRGAAISLLSRSWDMETTISTGGFYAKYHPEETIGKETYEPVLELLFIAVEARSDEAW